jgi:actin cytoskeleton-regulatory complex protein PAN1
MKFIHCGLAFYQITVGSAHVSTQHADAVPTGFTEAKSEEPQVRHGNVEAQKVAAEEQEDEESESSGDDYFSVADGDSEGENDIEDGTDADWEAREKERQRVLEAAGLIVNQDVQPPPRLARARSARQRRPPPIAPHRSSIISNSSVKDLPSIPDSPVDGSPRLDDAFNRYELYKHTQGASNRLSVASSFETALSSPGGSPAISLAASISKDVESRPKSHLLGFLGRRTPANDGSEKRTLTISGPIMNQPDSPSRENSPAFGSASCWDSNFLTF